MTHFLLKAWVGSFENRKPWLWDATAVHLITKATASKKKTQVWVIFTEIYWIKLQTMTSRYTDTQLLLCVYVHLWVCVWVYKEQWDHRKQNFPSEGPLGGLTRQRLASERALGDSVGRHTHTTHKPHKGEQTLFFWCRVSAYALSSLGIIKVLWVSTRKQVC